ncbi:MAG TPA: 5'/3'-nucleotidase SurE [Dehalococcoidia bacterium]|nr:5'/3'-nucleotidase SurE [Dehalococcoidia bacterium]
MHFNKGANLGDDVLLSGTIGAALQGYFRGLPSVALSVVVGKDMHFEVAASLASLLARQIITDFLSTQLNKDATEHKSTQFAPG